MDDIAARLAEAIEATGKTQAWVSVRSGVREETISHILTGTMKRPPIATLMRLAPVLEVSVGWLLGE
jgi:transcriptional regulator with XRE-family HTH domain